MRLFLLASTKDEGYSTVSDTQLTIVDKKDNLYFNTDL